MALVCGLIASRDFVACTRARIQALSLCWDRIDHERQRSERQQHERFLPTEEKEAEWTAMLHSRKLLKPQSSQRFSIIPSTAGLASSNNNNSSSGALSSRRGVSNNNSSSTSSAAMSLLQLEHMNEKLTSMQQVLTPFEIQRLQQNAYHVVRIAKRSVSCVVAWRLGLAALAQHS